MTVALPAEYAWGFVTGKIIHARGDQAPDADRLPEASAATGSVKFTPLTRTRRASDALVIHEVVSCGIGPDGIITDAENQPGVWLFEGAYRVEFTLGGGGTYPAFDIAVTAAHTIAAPLDLATAAPYVPPTGTPVTTMLIPAGPMEGYVLGWSGGALAWVAGGSGSGDDGGGGTVRRVTLNGSHVVDTSTWNTDHAQTVVFTQGGAGGHPVYHQGAPVDVAAAGATVTAWVWTGAAWRWFSDAATAEVVVDETPPTAGNLQLGVAATTITATSQGAMDETALHPQPFRFAIATAASSGAWSDAQWRAAMGAWQSSDTASLAGLTMGTAYNARCEVRDMAGNARLTAVASGTTTTVVEPMTYLEANFTAADGTLLTAYTPEVGTHSSVDNGNPTIYGNALWTVPDPEWQSQPYMNLPSTAPLKLIRWTFDYDFTTGGDYAGVNVSCGDYASMGVLRLPAGPAVKVGDNIAHGGTLVSNEPSPTAPAVPMAGRATIEFDGTPGVSSNWVHRIYIDVAGEPVLHTTVVVTRNLAATVHYYRLLNAQYQGTPGAVGTKLDRIHMEAVPA